MANTNHRWLLWRRNAGSDLAAVSQSQLVAEHSVDLELIIQAARLAVTTRTASKAMFIRRLYVTGDIADKLLARLEHCEVIAPDVPGTSRRVMLTSAQLPGVVTEFKRRHAERLS